jgi:hypothetical protein
MDKIRLRARAFDGVTVYEETPTFRQVDGWIEASLDTPVGIVPAALWGKVPGGDPYLLHINALTTVPLGPGDLFELQSGPPVQPRVQYRPTPDNTRLVLVRPTDRLRLLIAPQNPRSWSSCSPRASAGRTSSARASTTGPRPRRPARPARWPR